MKANAQAREKGYRKVLHNTETDFTLPLLSIPKATRDRIFRRLSLLYGDDKAREVMPELERILKVYYAFKPPEMVENEKIFKPGERFTEKDIILITYGDLLRGKERSPLSTLARFCDTYLQGSVNTLHILPFFPYSSDRGFAVIDFETVDPHLGSWQDIEELGRHYQLMFDGVINHVSSKSRWFQEFLNGNPVYRDFFITFDSPEALTPAQRKIIFRPRTNDILTEYMGIDGPVYVWTTFSPDQVDLNYKNPKVLLRVIKILLAYVQRGADIIRLDAVTYLWAEPGTRCIHLKQTHEIVKFFRDILDIVAPYVALITETNVPHEENIAYFGDGHDEAQMVYNFALPPLVLYTFYKEDATVLSQWAKTLSPPSVATTFFNFLDSHDGIGLMAVKNILSEEEVDLIVEMATERGGLVSYKTGEDGEEEPYEVNITWFSALNAVGGEEDISLQVKRFVSSRLIALVLKGVPGIYLHSLIGTENDIRAVLATRSNREINRTVLDHDAIEAALGDPASRIHHVNKELGRFITLRTRQRAFHPTGAQEVIDLSPSVFAVLRISPEGDQHILSLINITPRPVQLRIPLADVGIDAARWYDMIRGIALEARDASLSLDIPPYEAFWLTPLGETEGFSNPTEPSHIPQ